MGGGGEGSLLMNSIIKISPCPLRVFVCLFSLFIFLFFISWVYFLWLDDRV